MLYLEDTTNAVNMNTVVLAVVASVGTIITTIVTGVVAVYLAKINKKADDTKDAAITAAVKVEEVKTTLVNSDAKTDKKLNEIHSLVNSKFTTLLETNAIALRRVANVSRDADDEAAAVYAETALADHRRELESESEALKVEIVKTPQDD